MIKCHICGKSTATSQGLAGHKWLKHGGKTGQEGVLVQGAAAQQAQAPQQAQGQGSPVMVQVPASYLAQLQQQAQQAQLAQQGQGLGSADGLRADGSTLKTVRIDPFVEMAFDYFRREHGFDSDDLSDFINGCVRALFRQNDVSVFTPV